MKKINLIKVTILFLFVFTMSSCSSDDSKAEDNGITTGNYLPLAVGNKWNYTDGSNASLVQITGTTSFVGNTYYESDDSGEEIDIQTWEAKRGASYYEKAAETTYTEGSTTIVMQSYEMKLFKDDVAVGETWSGTASPQVHYSGPSGSGTLTAQINYEGTITAKDVSELVEGVTYNNVIKMQMDVVETVNSQVTTIHGEFWFAKDIGIIMDRSTSSKDNITKTRHLTSYELH